MSPAQRATMEPCDDERRRILTPASGSGPLVVVVAEPAASLGSQGEELRRPSGSNFSSRRFWVLYYSFWLKIYPPKGLGCEYEKESRANNGFWWSPNVLESGTRRRGV